MKDHLIDYSTLTAKFDDESLQLGDPKSSSVLGCKAVGRLVVGLQHKVPFRIQRHAMGRRAGLEDTDAPRAETGERTPRLYSLEHARHLVQEARAKAKMPKHVTLAACRHGGMIELGDAGLTEPQIMSAHQTPDAARVYVKRTELQRMSAARKRRQFVDRGK